MSFNTLQQLKSSIDRSNSVLLAFPYYHGNHLETLDGAASALALGSVLEKMGKKIATASGGFTAHPSFAVLPAMKKIQSDLPSLNHLIITVPSHAQSHTLEHETRNGELIISVKPDSGGMGSDGIRVRRTSFSSDLIITFGTRDLPSLGSIFRNHTNFFTTTPIANIDHAVANEAFGHINMIHPTAAAVSEITFLILERLAPDMLNKEIATMLLTGIIAATRSFKSQRVSQQTLDAASRLVQLGANREHIMEHLFRNRSLATIKLWGRALSHLRYDAQAHFVSTTLTRLDFLETAGNETELPEVVDELIMASPEADIVLLLHESSNTTLCGFLFSKKIPASELLTGFIDTEMNTQRSVRFCITGQSISNAENLITQKIKEKIG